MRPVTPGLETLCFRVHHTHLPPIADARVRTIALDSPLLGCLLESTSPEADTIMEHHRRTQAGGSQGAWSFEPARRRYVPDQIEELRSRAATRIAFEFETDGIDRQPRNHASCSLPPTRARRPVQCAC